jgi:hypothetical protein
MPLSWPKPDPQKKVDTTPRYCPYKGCTFQSSAAGVRVHMKEAHGG